MRRADGAQCRRTVAETMLQDCRAVLGVAAVAGHVYVARADSPDIDVYSAVTWSLRRRLPVDGLRSPTDLAAASERSSARLFVADWSQSRVHRVVDVQVTHVLQRLMPPSIPWMGPGHYVFDLSVRLCVRTCVLAWKHFPTGIPVDL